MENRRGDKIVEIEKYVESLKKSLPKSFYKYLSDEKSRMACERYFEKIVEAVVDLAFLVIKENDLKNPDYAREAFEILEEGNFISKELSLNLGNAKGMRNWLAHRYDKIDDRMVFDVIKNKLFKDVEEFLEVIK